MGRVLVTGATGFLGGAAARHLAANGWEVWGLGRAERALATLRDDGITPLRFDLAGDAPESLALPQIDAVVHSAALCAPTGPYGRFEAANVKGTATALEIARQVGCRRFVNISSSTVYFAMRDQESLPETAPLPSPFNAYAATKAKAEELVHRATDLGPITLRPRGIYGAGDTTLLPRLISAARRGPLPEFRAGQAAIDLTHVSDVVRAIEFALRVDTAAAGQVFNISGGEVLSIREIVTACCTALDIPVRWRRLPLRPALFAAGVAERMSRTEPRVSRYALALFAYRQSLDISKAGRGLGWQPHISFAEGLQRTIPSA